MLKKEDLKILWYYIKQIMHFDKLRLFGVVFTTAFAAFETWFVSVYILKVIIDTLINQNDYIRLVYAICLGIFCKTIKLIYDIFWNYYIKKSDNLLIKGFQKIAFEKASKMDIKCYDDATFYNEYVYSIKEAASRPIAFINSINQLFYTIFSVSFSGIYVVKQDPILICFIIFPILFDSFVRIKMREKRAERTNEIIPESKIIEYVKRTSYLREQAIDIRMTNIKNVLNKVYVNSVNNIINIYKKYSNKFIRMYFISDLLTHMNNTLIVLYLIVKIMIFKTLTVGDFAAVQQATSIVSRNLGKIIERIQVFQEHNIYIKRFKIFCDYKNEVVFGNKRVPGANGNNIIKVIDMNFAYEGNFVLKNINLSVNEGEKIAIVGKNGAGKSTLIKLILHLYDPFNGEIKFRGIDIQELKKEDYLSKFDVVFQEHNNYAFTLKENIAMETDIDSEKIEKIEDILKTFELNDITQYMYSDNVLSKEFSEEGIILSEGQNQKIALIRALYRNSDIIILDEPSSALDAFAEEKLNELIDYISKNRTVIMISHRLSTVKKMDRIYLMENGQIIESGTHNQLMELNGKYSEMYAIQSEAYKD